MPSLRGKTWTTTTPATVNDAQYWEDHLISDADAQKAANSVQTVNNISPDANGNVDVVALPAGGTAGQVLTKQSSTSGDADWEDPASSGHAIEDADGVTMAQQPTLQFVNADVTNDSVNSRTVIDCKGQKGDPGAAATISVGTTSTLSPGSSATVTNSGTTSAAVFNFGIPAGANGTNGTDGVSVTGVSLLSTSGRVKTYRMSFSNNTYFDFDVTDGADGSGAGDMLKSDYDSTSAVYNAGGIVAYVATQAYSLPTAAANTLGGVKVGTNLSIDGSGVLSATDTTYSDATQSAAGLMSSTDKTKLDGIASGAEVNVQADWNESNSSSDAYILNKPTIPAAQVNADWTSSSGVSEILHKPTIPVITNTYSSLSNDGMSGVAVASAISGKADSSDLDGWTSAVTLTTVGSDLVAVFDNLNNNYGYDPYGVDELLHYTAVTKGTGTQTGTIKLTYTFSDGTTSVSQVKLRILK